MPRPSRRAAKSVSQNDARRIKLDEEVSADEQEETHPQIKYPRTGKRGAPQVFPRKLFEILQNESEEVIAWTESGKSFVIKDMDVFVTHVLMKYFRHQKYSSFQRQLNLYGFRKISKGAETGAYCHEHFLKDQHDKLRLVRRTPQASTRSAHSAKDSKDSKRTCSMSKAARGVFSQLSRCGDSDDSLPQAFPSDPPTAWRIDGNGKRVHTDQPGTMDLMEAVAIGNASEELDKLEYEEYPDFQQDAGVLEGRAITHSPITLQPSSIVFDGKLAEDHRDLSLTVTRELNDLSSSVNNLALNKNDPFEMPTFTHSNPSEEVYLLDFDGTGNTMETDTRSRFRSLSMSSDDWPLPALDLGSMDQVLGDGAHRPPVSVTMER